MNPNIKKRFKEKMLQVASDFGLNEIMMTSYSRQFDNKTQLSATDMASAISALLETPISGATDNDGENVNPNRGAANNNNSDDQKSNSLAGIQGRLHDNFWVAYDALDLN